MFNSTECKNYLSVIAKHEHVDLLPWQMHAFSWKSEPVKKIREHKLKYII